jgi:uncharacterized coiled-coil DUF342 family protein
MTDYTNTYPDLVNVEDWLNAKGYTGEAGACHQAMSLIRSQEKRIADLRKEADMMHAEYKTTRARITDLKAALKPFASLLNDEGDYIVASPSLSDLRAARAAYRGEKD